MERGCERVWWELLLSELSPKSGIFLVPDTAPWQWLRVTSAPEQYFIQDTYHNSEDSVWFVSCHSVGFILCIEFDLEFYLEFYTEVQDLSYLEILLSESSNGCSLNNLTQSRCSSVLIEIMLFGRLDCWGSESYLPSDLLLTRQNSDPPSDSSLTERECPSFPFFISGGYHWFLISSQLGKDSIEYPWLKRIGIIYPQGSVCKLIMDGCPLKVWCQILFSSHHKLHMKPLACTAELGNPHKTPLNDILQITHSQLAHVLAAPLFWS